MNRLAHIVVNTLAVLGLLTLIGWWRQPAPAGDEEQRYETHFTPHEPRCVPDDDDWS